MVINKVKNLICASYLSGIVKNLNILDPGIFLGTAPFHEFSLVPKAH